jgi:hypothetical protein
VGLSKGREPSERAAPLVQFILPSVILTPGFSPLCSAAAKALTLEPVTQSSDLTPQSQDNDHLPQFLLHPRISKLRGHTFNPLMILWIFRVRKGHT